MKKNWTTLDDVIFSHFIFEEGDDYLIEAAKSNYIIFITKGRAKSERGQYNTGDIVFIPISKDFNIKFSIPGDILVIGFENTLDIFKELQNLLVVEDDSGLDEDLGFLKLKYPINIFVMLITRYIEDGIMTTTLSLSKLAELFIILKKYYNEKEIRNLFLPIVSSSPDFKLLVYSKLKFSYNVDQLAMACNMSKRSFENKFNEAFNGNTPYSWIQEQKAKKIAYKLSLHGVAIKDIMEEFNFYDSSHFNKFCRQWYGMTPEEFSRSIKRSER